MIGDKKILCVITARAGSKGIPGKNYRELLQKPLFIWSVEAALKSKYVDDIAISSNCSHCKLKYREFVDVGTKLKKNEVHWIDRPDKFATDTSKNEEALIHALRQFDKSFDIIINLQPTSPCRLDLLDKCIEAYYEGGYDSLLTANKDTPFIWQKKNGRWEYRVDNDCCKRKMRQEFDEDEFIYHDCGSVYMTDNRILLGTECRIGKNPCIFPVEGLNSLQIDTEFDFAMIESLAQSYDLSSLI